MAIDKILKFNYDKNTFDWTNSVLYDFLSEYYGLNDVKMVMSSGDEIIIKKYNVVGGVVGDDYISIYESNGELHKLIRCVNLEHIESLEVIF